MADRGDGLCRFCGKGLQQGGRGRKREFCDSTCRNRFHNRQNALQAGSAPAQDVLRLGNASKRLADTSAGEWISWRSKTRHARAIRFIETFCRPPKGFGAKTEIRLAPFQKERLEEWLADGVNSAAMSVARGNGKSTFLAALAVWAVFDPDESGAPQVPVVATTMNQAIRSVYGVALAMIRAETELYNRCLVFSAIGAQKVTVPFTGGELFPVSNDVDGLQGLDPSLAICDEIGFMPVESWDSLLLASGKRPRSLVVGIGTPGLDKDNALWHLRQRVHEGVALPGFRFCEYAADENCDVRDEAQWRKANPALDAGYQNLEALRTSVALSPEGHFRVFRLGQWVDGVDCWLGADARKDWDALAARRELEAGAPAWVGVDVGIKRDSTAVAVVQARPGGWHVKVRLWLPTASDAVDVTDVMEHIRRLSREVDVQAVSYDPRFFDVPAKMLEDEGLPMIEIPQSVERMTAAVGSLYEVVKRAELSHDGDEPVSTQVLNAVARYNERGFTLAKGKSRGRIDAAIAIALAVDLALRFDPPDAGAQVFFG